MPLSSLSVCSHDAICQEALYQRPSNRWSCLIVSYQCPKINSLSMYVCENVYTYVCICIHTYTHSYSMLIYVNICFLHMCLKHSQPQVFVISNGKRTNESSYISLQAYMSHATSVLLCCVFIFIQLKKHPSVSFISCFVSWRRWCSVSKYFYPLDILLLLAENMTSII